MVYHHQPYPKNKKPSQLRPQHGDDGRENEMRDQRDEQEQPRAKQRARNRSLWHHADGNQQQEFLADQKSQSR